MSEDKPQPAVFVIFGASGDLTKRKLIPALFSLYSKGRLPEKFAVVGFSRRPWGDDDFRAVALAGIQQFAGEHYDEAVWQAFALNLSHYQGELNGTLSYAGLKTKLDRLGVAAENRLYYLATPPKYFPEIVTHLGISGLVTETECWRRVIVEKPFGHDAQSAHQLNQVLHRHLQEHQIFRIDHYLAKETVQNILVFRFGNAIFEPLWNRNYIDYVQITAAEQVDVGSRAGYYDQAGVVRDMFQNHLLQLLSLVAMESPVSFGADDLRNEKVKVFSAVKKISSETVAATTVRAQYVGYLDAPGVAAASMTPTYAALKLSIDNWRWQGVPFYLRSGKALAKKSTEIIIQFKRPPHNLFPNSTEEKMLANHIALCIQPKEAIHLQFAAKEPDTVADMGLVKMDFQYNEYFGKNSSPEAYERLLLNALNGDASLFTRADGIELAWGIIDPILAAWESASAPAMTSYAPGSWGPDAADQLLAQDGRHWHKGCGDLGKK